MYVIKRNGSRQEIDFKQISDRIKELSYGLDSRYIDPEMIAKRTIEGLYDEIHTSDIDQASEYICASMATRHSDFSKLAARIAISNLHKRTEPLFSDYAEKAHSHISKQTGEHVPLISSEVLNIAIKHKEKIESAIDHQTDYTSFDFFGFKTLEKGYLIADSNGSILERPQHMYMRVAIGIHGDDIDRVLETYTLMSEKKITHASPTMFNAGTRIPQMASCFLLTMKKDSMGGIYDTLHQCARISKSGGGLSVAVSNIRAEGSFIRKSRGYSNGLIPMLKVFNETARYVDQGGKRKGAFAIYLEPWHADVEGFLELKLNSGAEELRTRDLFLALWVPDLFMKRVEEDGKWSLFCPKEAPGLMDSHGKEFEDLYTTYESEGRMKKTVKARDIWAKIIRSQIETGTPYILYKDSANQKSNQQNLGTIHSSNLCTEIIQYSDKDEVAMCNLASIALSEFVKEDGTYDFNGLHDAAIIATRNINRVIDRTHYPLPEAEKSNLRHRPIGIGVQGLADVFAMMKMSFGDAESRRLNKDIFETIYHGAVSESIELAKKEGSYESFPGSPASKGLFQFDMWGIIPDSGLWEWAGLRDDMRTYGLRNSLLIAPMPTASTAQILGNTEAFEPFNSNMYVRRVLSGEFIVLNKHLVRDLIEMNLWDEDMRKKLIAEQGSIQNIPEIPVTVRERYRTVWEISQKVIIDMAADRAPYICQNQSMNIHIADATPNKVTSMHFYGWKKGLKSSMYYLRNTPSRAAVQFTVDNSSKYADSSKKNITETISADPVDNLMQEKTLARKNAGNIVDDDPNICISCGS